MALASPLFRISDPTCFASSERTTLDLDDWEGTGCVGAANVLAATVRLRAAVGRGTEATLRIMMNRGILVREDGMIQIGSSAKNTFKSEPHLLKLGIAYQR